MALGGRHPGFGSNPLTGSDRARGSLHLKWYQSLGLGCSTNDFEIFMKRFFKLFIAFAHKG